MTFFFLHFFAVREHSNAQEEDVRQWQIQVQVIHLIILTLFIRNDQLKVCKIQHSTVIVAYRGCTVLILKP